MEVYISNIKQYSQLEEKSQDFQFSLEAHTETMKFVSPLSTAGTRGKCWVTPVLKHVPS